MSSLPVNTVAEYRSLAQARLDAGAWNYLADGDSEGNERALAAVRLMPRPLQDVRGGHTRLTLFGQQLEHPILLAPIAYQRLFHADGEVASAMAAAAQGCQLLVSSLASQPFDAIVRAAHREDGSGPWFQLYWQGNRERTLRLLGRALAAGCSAVVLTVDAPVKVASMQLPEGVAAVNLENYELSASGGSMVFDSLMAQAPSWDDLAWLRQQTTLPLLVKGLLHPDDAERAVDAGCDGIVVSNHGDRVLKGAAISLPALAHIVRRVDGCTPVLFDSGVRDGRDVFVALAYGATAVLVGRPYVWGLASAGAMGVAHVIRLMRDELEMTMALTGCAHLADIGLQSISA
ncbi:alpha-hydroxy acid oxidase [soil metagenome]